MGKGCIPDGSIHFEAGPSTVLLAPDRGGNVELADHSPLREDLARERRQQSDEANWNQLATGAFQLQPGDVPSHEERARFFQHDETVAQGEGSAARPALDSPHGEAFAGEIEPPANLGQRHGHLRRRTCAMSQFHLSAHLRGRSSGFGAEAHERVDGSGGLHPVPEFSGACGKRVIQFLIEFDAAPSNGRLPAQAAVTRQPAASAAGDLRLADNGVEATHAKAAVFEPEIHGNLADGIRKSPMRDARIAHEDVARQLSRNLFPGIPQKVRVHVQASLTRLEVVPSLSPSGRQQLSERRILDLETRHRHVAAHPLRPWREARPYAWPPQATFVRPYHDVVDAAHLGRTQRGVQTRQFDHGDPDQLGHA